MTDSKDTVDATPMPKPGGASATAVLPLMSREQGAVQGPPRLGCSEEQWHKMIALADECLDLKVGTVCNCGEYCAKLFIAVQIWNCTTEQERDIEGMSNSGPSVTLQRWITQEADGKTRVQMNALKAKVKFSKEDFDRCYHIYA